MKKFKRIEEILFPERQIFKRKLPFYKQIILLLFLTGIFYITSKTAFGDTYRGYDWIHFWEKMRVPAFYPPWTSLVVSLLNWHILVAITFSATLVAALIRAEYSTSAILVFFTLPLWWTIYLGQLEGFATLGLLWLPWLTPLALTKPQITFFAFGAKKNYLMALIVFLLISIIIWGLWPVKTLSTVSMYEQFDQDISIGLYGIFIAVPLFWLSRGDMDMLMLAGAFTTTHLIPYNLLPAIPSIARLKPLPALIAVLLSWLPLCANWLGPQGWWLGWLFVGWLWLALAFKRYPIIKEFCIRDVQT